MFRLLALGTIVSFFSVSYASTETKNDLSQYTCEDYIAVDVQYQPVITGYALAYNQKNQLESGFIDVEGIEKVTPEAIGNICVKKPEQLLHKAIDELRNKK